MRYNKILLFLLSTLFLMASICSCGAEKEVEQRKNLMMPKKSEMMRNSSHYKEAGKRPVNKKKSHKNKRKGHY